MTKIEQAWQVYESAVDDYCKEQFEKHVKPYCMKHDCEFLAGNGTWWLTNPGKRIGDMAAINEHPDEYHPTYDILCEKIPGMASNDVGSLMPDYKKEACDNETLEG